MKIDIHCHTEKTKSGDPNERGIQPIDFDKIVRSTDVKIICITNHNAFNKKHYDEMVKLSNNDYLLWPGIEIDIIQNDGFNGHLLVICNPKNADNFSNVVQNLVNQHPDNFKCDIQTVASSFDELDVIYVAHYYNKKPSINDDSISDLEKVIKNSNRIIKEASNFISAGIFVNHGHNAIYGSDIQDWSNYPTVSKELPRLKLPVDSFEQFCLLLEKNESTIKTLLDTKDSEVITMKPFENNDEISLKFYDDVNIIFGPKGTGKSKILEGIASYYTKLGLKTDVYVATSDLDTDFDKKGANLNFAFDEMDIDTCETELDDLSKVEDVNITTITEYYKHFESKSKNTAATKLKIKDIDIQIGNEHSSNYTEVIRVKTLFNSFLEDLNKSNIISKSEIEKEVILLNDIINQILPKLEKFKNDEFTNLKIQHLFNNMINIYNSEISKKVGEYKKPTKTGFYEYAVNRINIDKNISKTINNLKKDIIVKDVFVGELEDKGIMNLVTKVTFQNGDITDSKLEKYNTTGKRAQKDIARSLLSVKASVYRNNLFEKLGDFVTLKKESGMKSLEDLILFRRFYAIDGNEYNPSSGESSMILLQNELIKEKNIFLLDEPEKSLGNEYISEIIVPLLKKLAEERKRVIIATHDANIAVRTLPFNSIYREHNNGKYKTYNGNPFSNYLINNIDNTDKKDWKKTSMKTLEGGKEAFGERGLIYGEN